MGFLSLSGRDILFSKWVNLVQHLAFWDLCQAVVVFTAHPSRDAKFRGAWSLHSDYECIASKIAASTKLLFHLYTVTNIPEERS